MTSKTDLRSEGGQGSSLRAEGRTISESLALISMPPGPLPLEVFQAGPPVRRPRVGPGTRWIPLEEPLRLVSDGLVLNAVLSLLPLRMKMDGRSVCTFFTELNLCRLEASDQTLVRDVRQNDGVGQKWIKQYF